MLRFVTAALVSAILTAGNASAATKPAAQPDLSRARCEDPRVVAYIKDTLPKMTAGVNGPSFSQVLGNNANLKATTVAAEPSRLVCSVVVNVQYNGNMRGYRGRFTLRYFPGGKVSATFAPYY